MACWIAYNHLHRVSSGHFNSVQLFRGTVIAPNLWLLNLSNFNPVDYRMLQEWVRAVNILCRMLISWGIVCVSCWVSRLWPGSVGGWAELCPSSQRCRFRFIHLIDRQTDGHWSSDWSVVIRADGMSYGQRWTFWTFDIVQCFTVALHCWSIRFHTLYNVSLKCYRR